MDLWCAEAPACSNTLRHRFELSRLRGEGERLSGGGKSPADELF